MEGTEISLFGSRPYTHIYGLLSLAKQTKFTLQKSRATLNETQRLAYIGSWELDLETDSLAWSEEIFRIFEVNPADDEVSYAAFLGYVHPDDRNRVDLAYRASVKNRQPYSIEHRLLLPDGRIKYVHDRYKTIYDLDGNPVRSIGTVQDITARVRADKENKKLRARFEQAQRLDSIGRLAGGVAHDFNNMLMVILGRTELALYKLGFNHPLCPTLEEIRGAAQSSANLTRQLLAFARSQPTTPRLISLNEHVQETLKMMRRLIGEDISLVWKPADALGLVRMDPGQVDQILVNLCVNARDAIATKGEITIETRNVTLDRAYCDMHVDFVPGNYIAISVSDTGCGMAADTVDHVFEPFFTTKKPDKGTGLGLATVYGIVKQNGGFINVYSEPAMGTTFNIYLENQGPVTTRKAPDVRVRPPQGNGETVLFVEDEAMILALGRKTLETLGYKVLAADTPLKALALAKAHTAPVDLMVTDVVLPEMTAGELTDGIRSIQPAIDILYISGYSASVAARHGVLHEKVAFLQKPFSTIELAVKVRETIGKPVR